MGFPRCFHFQSSLNSLSGQRFARDCILIDNRVYSAFEKTITSPHLHEYSVLLSIFFEKDLTIEQITKLEHSRNYVSELRQAFPQSSTIRLLAFMTELARSKSPYFQATIEQGTLDKAYKTLLKENQGDPALWLAYTEVEALLDPTSAQQKIEGLSKKVLASFASDNKFDTKILRLAFLDQHFRMSDTSPDNRLSAFIFALNLAMETLSDLRIDISKYASDLKEVCSDKYSEISECLSKYGSSFLVIFKLLEKLLTSYMQVTAQTQLENTVEGSFVNKRSSISITEFCVITFLWSFFGSISGIDIDQPMTVFVSDWFNIMQAKITMLTNVYVKQLKTDILLREIKAVVLMSHNLVEFLQRTLPQRAIRLSQLFSRVYREILPLDQSILELMIEDSIQHAYRFQLISDLKQKGVSFTYSEVLFLIFKLQRKDPQAFENLQSYLISDFAASNLSKQLLHDMKTSLKTKPQEGIQRSHTAWFDCGIDIEWQNNALLCLQEIKAQSLLQKDSPSAVSELLTLLHSSPYNKVK
jgi:hypothetical protein